MIKMKTLREWATKRLQSVTDILHSFWANPAGIPSILTSVMLGIMIISLIGDYGWLPYGGPLLVIVLCQAFTTILLAAASTEWKELAQKGMHYHELACNDYKKLLDEYQRLEKAAGLLSQAIQDEGFNVKVEEEGLVIKLTRK